jgi:hypothetical protein
MPRKPSTATKTKPAEEEVEDLEVEETDEDEDTTGAAEDTDEVDDLEVEEDEDEEPAPTKAKGKTAAKKTEAKPKTPEIQYGSAWLAEHVNAQTGSNYNAFGIRTLLRKLVKDGVIQRDVGTDRSRYNFEAGAKDPVVRAVVKAVKDGSAETAKKEKIAEAKAAAAKKTEVTKAKPAAKKKAAPEPEVADEDDDMDEDVEDL